MSPTSNPTVLYVKVPKGVPELDCFKFDQEATVDLDQDVKGGFITKLVCKYGEACFPFQSSSQLS